MAERIGLYGLPLDIGVTEMEIMQRISTGNLLLTYLNPLAYHIAKIFPDYPLNLHRFDLIVCDGIGVQKAVRAVYGKATPILTPDLSGIGQSYLKHGAKHRMSLCLVGGRPTVAEAASKAVATEFAGYSSIHFFNGYGESPNRARDHVLATRPDMILVGLGMGRQEAWLLSLVEAGWRGIGICVGGFFDKLANPELGYPEWSERLRLRFLGRLVTDPRRMSKRYFIHYQPFVAHYLKSLLVSSK